MKASVEADARDHRSDAPSSKLAIEPQLVPDAATIASALEPLGATGSQQRLYRILLLRGCLTAGEAADAAKLARGRIYDQLRGLVDLGLASEELVEPARYYPVPFVDVLENHRQEALRRAEDLSAQLKGLTPAAVRTTDPPRRNVVPRDVSIAQGRRAVLDALRRTIVQAETRLRIHASGPFASRLARNPPILALLRSGLDRGVDVQLVLHPEAQPPSVRRALRAALGPTAVKEGLASTGVTRVASERQALLIVPQPDDENLSRGEDFGLVLSADVFGQDAIDAVDAASRTPERPAPTHELQAPPELVTAVAEAKEEIAVVLPDAWMGTVDAAWTSILAVLSRHRESGVRFRIILESLGRPTAFPWESFGEVRTTPRVVMGFALIDRRVMVQGFHGPAGAPAEVRVSRGRLEVQHYCERFNGLWEGAELSGRVSPA